MGWTGNQMQITHQVTHEVGGILQGLKGLSQCATNVSA